MAIRWAKYSCDYAGLAFKFKVNPDSCGRSEHYEEYLRFIALSDYNSGKGVTYVLLDIDDNTGDKSIMGFITLRTSSLIMMKDNYYEGRSAIEITELAIDINYERKGFGTHLVNFAGAMADVLRKDSIGIEYMVLCSDPESVGFYKKCGFSLLSTLYEIPREGWNIGCTPMLMRFPELNLAGNTILRMGI